MRAKDAKKLTALPIRFHRSRAGSSLAILAATLALLSALLNGVSPVFAEKVQFEPIDNIKATARAFLSKHSEVQEQSAATVSIGSIDTRLTLPACDNSLDAFLPPGANIIGKTTIGVRCQTPRPWTLYVPAKVTSFSQVLATNAPLRRGHIISAEDVSLETRDSSSLNRAYLSSPEDAIGKVLKRNLARNALLSNTILAEPNIISKGQQVDLQAGGRGLQVSVTGIALSGGAIGEKIRVKNLSSSKIVEGTILGSGAVQAD